MLTFNDKQKCINFEHGGETCESCKGEILSVIIANTVSHLKKLFFFFFCEKEVKS